MVISAQVFGEYEEARKFKGSGIQEEKQKHLERDRRIDGRIRKSFLEIAHGQRGGEDQRGLLSHGLQERMVH
jgi:hypothetical protein